jgi:hypothetical protein
MAVGTAIVCIVSDVILTLLSHSRRRYHQHNLNSILIKKNSELILHIIVSGTAPWQMNTPNNSIQIKKNQEQ